MTTTTSRPVPVAPPRAGHNGTPPQRGNGAPAPETRVAFGKIADGTGHRVVLYGPGGIGKTTLAATAPGPVAFFDMDDSLPRLRASFAGSGLQLDVRPIDGVLTWQNIRDALHASGWEDAKTIVLDSATRAEELAVAHTIATVPHDKREIVVRRLEDYGYGKGHERLFAIARPPASRDGPIAVRWVPRATGAGSREQVGEFRLRRFTSDVTAVESIRYNAGSSARHRSACGSGWRDRKGRSTASRPSATIRRGSLLGSGRRSGAARVGELTCRKRTT